MLGPIACVIARRPIARGEEVLSLSLESGYLDEGGSFPIQKNVADFCGNFVMNFQEKNIEFLGKGGGSLQIQQILLPNFANFGREKIGFLEKT